MNQPQNNGYKVFTLLVEYNTLTGLPTGRQKPNVPSDPNYITPVFDTDACPPGIGAATMTIIVVIDAGYTVDISVTFGGAKITRSTSGNWVVPIRIYDAVQFDVSVAPDDYICKVTYNGGLTKQATLATVQNILIPGPYPMISKIEIYRAILGDFNNDFNTDFYI